MSTIALSAHRLTKDYGDGAALRSFTATIEAGERVALIGHNGSGKTTLLRLAAGLLDVTSGRIEIFGRAPNDIESRRQLSYLPDTPAFYDDLSVWEHLEYTARLHGVRDWVDRAADLLGRLGLDARADDLPTRFSRGLKQKTALALAVVRPFDLLLVDEPFVGLDANGKEVLLSLLDEASEGGAAIVVATHEPSFLDRVARVIALRNGELVHDGPPNQGPIES
jgi:ABC-type multidrug transport system ATPase subunit